MQICGTYAQRSAILLGVLFLASGCKLALLGSPRGSGTHTNAGVTSLLAIATPGANSAFGSAAQATLTGLCAGGLPISINGTGITSAGSASCGILGDFSLQVGFSGSDGTKTVLLEQVLSDGTVISASRDLIYDTVAPTVSISAGPGAVSSSPSPAFAFSGADPGGSGLASYLCSLDGGAYANCATPIAYSGMVIGAHQFHVKSLDGASNASAISTYNWTIASSVPGGSNVRGLSVGHVDNCVVVDGTARCWGRNDTSQLADGSTVLKSTPVVSGGFMSGVQMVAPGDLTSCALVNGGAKCWGKNDMGGVGDATNNDRALPVDVSGLTTGVAAVIASNGSGSGQGRNCAITTTGGLKCWGYGLNGALGDGNNTNSNVPVDALGLTSGVSQLGAGANHSCAVVNGGLKCWGQNDKGQLGDGTNNNNFSPTDVPGLTSGIAMVDAGGTHTCAITVGGGLKCWGWNFYGQLGDGTNGDSNVPLDIFPDGSGVTFVSAGNFHTCAVIQGAVKCWGYNGAGGVGDNSLNDRNTPTQVVGLTSGATQVHTGYNHTCAMVNGSVKCWGSDVGTGCLGNGQVGVTVKTPVDVSGLITSMPSLSAGQYHSCVQVNGGAKCWGANTNGQLGDGTSFDRGSATDVTGLTDGVSSVIAGGQHSCAIRNGRVWCWGKGAQGQLGNGATAASLTPVDTGVDAEAIALGSDFGCMIDSGDVKCWGDNSSGQIGDRSNNNRSSPTAVAGVSGAQAIAVGYYHACALVDGAVWCWGSNAQGQLGDGTTANRTAAVIPIGLSSGVRSIYAGSMHTCAVLTSGAIKCWGNNADGQVGDGTQVNRNSPVDATVITAAGINVQNLYLGDSATCALGDGGAKCWGSNTGGLLGDGTTTRRLTPVAVTGLASGVQSLALGQFHTCALVDGRVQCWGANANSQLGDNTTLAHLTATDVSPILQGITKVVTSGVVTCAIISGKLKCWGTNTHGELGDGTTNDSHVPIDVATLSSGVQDVAVGGETTCAIVNGGLKCWGLNQAGQVGDASTTERDVPTDVSGLGAGSGVTQVFTANYYACALLSSGASKCWGFGGNGGLGDGVGAGYTTPQTPIGMGSGVIGIGGGAGITCWILAGGAMSCAGANPDYEVGDGTQVDRLTPVPIIASGVTQIVGAVWHACAKVGSGIKCWGYDGFGNMGNGPGSTTNTTPGDVPGLTTGVAAIAALGQSSCALLDVGTVKCWGHDTFGTLGDGTGVQQDSPVDVLDGATGLALTNVAAIAGNNGSSTACALLTTGKVKCWGYNGEGEVGDASVTNRLSAVDVFGLW